MRKWKINSINLMFPIQVIVALVLGYTGLVDWWVILFVWVMVLDITVTFE